ncbi:MAG: DUF2249 domain-containing protein [Opitutaceae bacterium]|nr:DUF2249 domain-containing protein [Opitutaceae bacterium]
MSESRLDLTTIPEAEHEEALAFAWAALEVGTVLLLVAPTMPLALLHKFFHSREGVFAWNRVGDPAGRCHVAVRRLGPDPLHRREVPRSPALASVVRLAPQPDRAARRLLAALETGRQGSVVHGCVRGRPDTVLRGLRRRGLEHFCEYAGEGTWIVSVRHAPAGPSRAVAS